MAGSRYSAEFSVLSIEIFGVFKNIFKSVGTAGNEWYDLPMKVEVIETIFM